jgi:3-isopropylmalate/(R)-2-methylmalate dehydratase small subunit
MEGLDDSGLTLKNIDDVTAFEKQRPAFKPETLPVRS